MLGLVKTLLLVRYVVNPNKTSILQVSALLLIA